MLVFDLLAFERGQAAKLHIQDRLRLQLAQLEARHQPFFSNLRILGFADRLNHRVQVIQCD